MKHVSELRAILSIFLDWHKPRLDCLGQMIQVLFVVRTINLTQVASAFKSEVKEESNIPKLISVAIKDAAHFQKNQTMKMAESTIS
jgi:hypothetical protein